MNNPGLIFLGCIVGFFAWFVVRCLGRGFFTVDQNERAVKTSFGRAERVGAATTLDDPIAKALKDEERERYCYPQVRVIHPGGPYFKWPWEQVHKVVIATQTMNMAYDPESPTANTRGTVLEAVTKDQLNTGLTGQIRYRVSRKESLRLSLRRQEPDRARHGIFRLHPARAHRQLRGTGRQSIVRGRGETRGRRTSAIGISINDLRKNLRDINDHMDRECASSEARYGITLDASLITGIDPPPEVESALAAINTAHNQVSSDISLAQASADQKIVQSKRAVEIETLKAQAEVEPLMAMADATGRTEEKRSGRSVRLSAQRPPQALQPGPPRHPGGEP